MKDNSKLSTESYKGVRDFYPEDLFVQNYIFNAWKTSVEKFGYIEYSASVLEPAELYRAKSGEEIVNEQTYTFTDRGDREVTLRPEMTPSVARLVAARAQDLTFPLRWYSIPNLFRYEKPQRGRLREHWQLNLDLFGIESNDADVEIISLSYEIMKKFGAKDTDFEIRLSNRKLMEALYKKFDLNAETSNKISKIIDKKNKIINEVFESSIKEMVGEKTEKFISLLSSPEKLLEFIGEKESCVSDILQVIEGLNNLGVTNVIFDPSLMRGFDYYTGIVFEVFDTDSENNRSIFGGGRYDDLLDIFDAKKVPAVGFGAGDVTAKYFLITHNLVPAYKPSTDVYICLLSSEFRNDAQKFANKLRESGINVALDLSNKKLGDQVKSAHKQMIPYVICIGENEVKSGEYMLKNMETGIETKGNADEIVKIVENK